MAGGRPTSLTTELQASLVQLIERGIPVSTSCDREGIPYATVCKWMKRAGEPYESFATAIKNARAKAAEPMIEAIREGVFNWQARAWYLERSDPKNWGRKDKLEKTVTTTTVDKDKWLKMTHAERAAELRAALAEEEAAMKGEVH